MTIARAVWPLIAVLAIAGGCFDESVPSSFSGGHVDDAGADAGGDSGDAGFPSGDGGGCPILTMTLTVSVVDAVNGAEVCDATVTAASASGASITLPMQGNPATCAYSAGFPPPPPGTYTVTVTAPNYLSTTVTGIVITQDVCGTTAPSVTVHLHVPPADAGTRD
jgi:hypothetical protein